MSRRSKKLLLLYILSGILCIILIDRIDRLKYVKSLNNQNALLSEQKVDTLSYYKSELFKNCYWDVRNGEELQNICQIDYNCSEGMNHTWPADPIIYNYSQLSAKFTSVQEGGSWAPCDCVPDSKLAVVIPYRDRDIHLRVLLNNLIPFLQTQKKAFRIFVIEQGGDEVFNRAALLNVGFIEASKREGFDCFIFHDVDLVPLDLCNLYVCGEQPRHLAVAINKFHYNLPYSFYCGGALAVHNSTVWTINGFTNVMFGWGGEDDDTYARFRSHGFELDRYSRKIGKYKMIKHKRDEGNPSSGRTLRQIAFHWKYSTFDGLNSVNYTLMSEGKEHLYTHIVVRLPGPKDTSEAKKFLKERQSVFRKLFMKDTELRKKVYQSIKKIRHEMRNYNPPKREGSSKEDSDDKKDAGSS